jgi:undecaprenyl-diphosphatase
MLQLLDQLDRAAFSFLNGLGTPALDPFMLLLSAKYPWIPLYLLIIGVIIWKYKSHFWLPLLYVLIVFATDDHVTSGIMKPFFARLRPCHDPLLPDVILIKGCGGQYGFASSHAANTMGLAISLIVLFGKNAWTYLLLVWALLVGYSRIYLGVHFPGDVITGMLIGLIAASLWKYLILKGLSYTKLQSPFHQ